ncbi:hypothetical protein VTK56DRAFT_6598 [Thermocarpiscus australiensis]
MVEHRAQGPVQNSEVYVLRKVPTFSTFSPLSPPSPITPDEDDFCGPIDALSLAEPAIAACDKKLVVEERLSTAVHVLATETATLQNLTRFYSTDRLARDGFSRAVDAITSRQGDRGRNGKLVVIGVGKSGHIARKLVATFNSLAIQAVFLHPTEALHGDLGLITRHDTLLLITFSGRTPELLTLLPHLDPSLPLILLTGQPRPAACELLRLRPDNNDTNNNNNTILLPAPVHEPETASFGVAAPTSSTTAALALADALALVAARELHHHHQRGGGGGGVAAVFARNHPGGAIGASLRRGTRGDVRSLAVAMEDIADLDGRLEGEGEGEGGGRCRCRVTGADVLRAGYASPSGWVRLCCPGGWGVVSPRRIRRLRAEDLSKTVEGELGWLAAASSEFVPVAASTSVQRAAEWIRGVRGAAAAAAAAAATGGEKCGDDDKAYGEDAIVAVMETGECVGLLEVGRLLEAADELDTR